MSSRLTLFKASFTEAGIGKEFGVSKDVTILGISLFVVGIGLGPLFFGPLSEVYGRNIVYQVSYTFFFIFSWPVAFAPDIGVQIVFLEVKI
jgi:MFS family permease